MDTDLEANSVTQFLETLNQVTSKSKRKTEKKLIWFRGESSIWRTPLVPNSYRVLADTFNDFLDDLFNSQTLKDLEGNINAEFYRKSFPQIVKKGIDNTPWNRYFLMQHYKVKTRLLDWTENALVALFFAVNDKSTIKDDAKIWILEPFDLNNYTVNTITGSKKSFPIIPYGYDNDIPQDLITDEGKVRLEELTRRYLRMDFDHKESHVINKIYHPLAMYPLYLDERMSAQKTCFTIFGNKINGLLSIQNHDDFLFSIKINGSNKLSILEELKLLGIDYETIYPDLDGLGISINNKFHNEFFNNTETLIHILNKTQRKGQ